MWSASMSFNEIRRIHLKMEFISYSFFGPAHELFECHLASNLLTTFQGRVLRERRSSISCPAELKDAFLDIRYDMALGDDGNQIEFK